MPDKLKNGIYTVVNTCQGRFELSYKDGQWYFMTDDAGDINYWRWRNASLNPYGNPVPLSEETVRRNLLDYLNAEVLELVASDEQIFIEDELHVERKRLLEEALAS